MTGMEKVFFSQKSVFTILLIITTVLILSGYSDYVLDNGLHQLVEGFVVLIAVVGIWFGYGISRRLTALKQDIDKLARGDVNVDLLYANRNDEIGEVSRSLRLIKEYIIERAQMSDMYEFQYRKLIEFQKQADELLMRSVDATVVANSDGIIVQVNKAAENFFGYEKFNFLGKKVEMLVPARYGNHEVRRNAYKENPVYRPMNARGNLYGLKSDGSEFPVTISITPVESLDGKRFIAVIHDETERKNREDELRKLAAVAENTRNIIIITDAIGKVEWVNLAFENITGYLLYEIRGRKLTRVMEMLAADKNSIEKVSKVFTKGGYARVEIQSKNKNGDSSSLDLSIQEIIAEKGIENFILIASDVTERRQLENMLVQANTDLELRVMERTRDLELALEKADEAAMAKANFLATMSHEIRTPINSVMGMAELLKKTSLNDKQYQMLNAILSSSNILRTVIDDILDFSKIDAGKLKLENIRLSVRDTLAEVTESLGSIATDKSIKFVVATDPRLPDVMGDPVRLRQIIYNLVGNAIKFTPEAGQVCLFAEQLTCNDEYVDLKIVVRDTGVGIDQADQKRLFQPFSQVDGSTTRKFGGTGLGLSIVSSLVELMDGSIDLVSEKGVGSAFSVYLKLPIADSFIDLYERSDCNVVLVDVPEYMASMISIMCGYRNVHMFSENDINQIGNTASLISNMRKGKIVVIHEYNDSMDCVVNKIHDVITQCKSAMWILLKSECLEESHDGIYCVQKNPLNINKILDLIFYRDVINDIGDVNNLITNPDNNFRKIVDGKSCQKILVVDDNSFNQDLFKMQLEILGYESDVADNGTQALERLKSGDYMMVLTDYHMPEMDGLQLLKEIRALEKSGMKKIPVISITADVLISIDNLEDNIYFDDCLNKPLSLDMLAKAVNKWSSMKKDD